MRAAAVLLLGTVLFASCGYTTESMLPEGVRTVAIEMYGNDEFYREIEFQLTRELTQEINHRTMWRLTRQKHADAVLGGRILRVRRPTLVETTSDLVSEQAVIVTAEVTLTDSRTGKQLERFVTSNRAEFILERGESVDTAFAEALHDLAEQIINRLQSRSFLREMDKERNNSDSK